MRTDQGRQTCGRAKRRFGVHATRSRIWCWLLVLAASTSFAQPAPKTDWAKDSWRHGDLSYATETWASDTERPGQQLHWKSEDRLVFRPGYVLHSTEGLDNGRRFKRVFVKRPDARFLLEEADSKISVTFDDVNPFPRADHPLMFVSEKPNMPLGIYWIRAKNAPADPRSEEPISLDLTDGTRLLAKFAPDLPLRPVSLDRYFQGRADPVNRWRYEGLLGTTGQLGLPKHSTYEGPPGHRATFDFHSFHSALPAETAFDVVWFAPGIQVYDNRAGRPLAYSHEGLLAQLAPGEKMTPTKLLEISRAFAGKSREMDVMSERFRRAKAKEDTKRLLVAAGLAALVFGVGAVAILLRRRSA